MATCQLNQQQPEIYNLRFGVDILTIISLILLMCTLHRITRTGSNMPMMR